MTGSGAADPAGWAASPQSVPCKHRGQTWGAEPALLARALELVAFDIFLYTLKDDGAYAERQSGVAADCPLFSPTCTCLLLAYTDSLRGLVHAVRFVQQVELEGEWQRLSRLKDRMGRISM